MTQAELLAETVVAAAKPWKCGQKSCYWYEQGNGCAACRSPKHKWTDEDNAEWLESRGGKINQWTVKSGLPPFKPERHCAFRQLKPGEKPFYMVM